MSLRRANQPNYTHIYRGTKPLKKLYKGSTLIWETTNPPAITRFNSFPDNIDLDAVDNSVSSRVTFVRERTGVYGFAQAPPALNSEGAQSGFNGLVVMRHYYINTPGRIGNVPSNVHYYQLAIANSDSNYRKYSSIVINGRTYPLTRAPNDNTLRGVVSREYWTTSAINSRDWVTDNRLSLDIQFNVSGPTDNLYFSVDVGATTGQITTARILMLPAGTRVGSVLNSNTGAGISQRGIEVPRPNQTTTYRLLASNTGGTSHRDEVVTVTQNPTIESFRRTGFSQRPDGTRFQFTARITGTPQPVITWRFGNGRQSQRGNDSIHFTPVTGRINTWDAVWGQGLGIIHTNTSDSLVWTATNSSGSVSATINNIST